MKTHVEFQSDKFPAYESEQGDINPGRYGKRVAEFLSAGLKVHGFEPEELIAEDWGWIVPIKNDDFKLRIGCGNLDERPGGFLCFIDPHEPVIRRLFKKVDTRARVEALQAAMDAVLAESVGIRDKKWWTYEEFNNPST
jgi:hypothetical protein